MHSLRTFASLTLCLAAFAGIATSSAKAQPAAYPDHTVRVIVPAPPGGTNDIVARIVAQHLGQALGQSFVVENKGGGNGAIAAGEVARATPDGYTVFVAYSGVLSVNEHLMSPPTYNPAKDYAPISLLAEVPIVLVANPKTPADTLKDFVTYARAHPDTINFGIPAIGSFHHLLAEQLKSHERLDIALIPYQGSGPAIKDLLGGQTNAHFENVPAVIALLQAGKLKALAATGDQRIPLLPDVPTTAEQGFPYLKATPWFALVVPAGVPVDIQHKLNEAVVAVLKTPEIKAEFANLGASPRWSTQEEARNFIDAERAKWGQVIRESHITAQ